jgi:transporter family-2 protein
MWSRSGARDKIERQGRGVILCLVAFLWGRYGRREVSHLWKGVMESLVIIVVMFFVGFLIAFQGAVNTALARMLSHPLHATFVSFLSGTLVLGILLAISGINFPRIAQLVKVPKLLFIGGTLGVVYITCVLMFIPKVGTARVAIAGICGQIVFALIIDHYGLMGIPVSAVDAKRVFGTLLVVAGLLVINLK